MYKPKVQLILYYCMFLLGVAWLALAVANLNQSYEKGEDFLWSSTLYVFCGCYFIIIVPYLITKYTKDYRKKQSSADVTELQAASKRDKYIDKKAKSSAFDVAMIAFAAILILMPLAGVELWLIIVAAAGFVIAQAWRLICAHNLKKKMVNDRK